MEPLSIATLITGIISAITGIVGGISNAVNTQKTNQQQIDLQNESWEKQSISYRMDELERAGLNKQLATGMSPNYQVSARLQTPDWSQALDTGKLLDTLGSVQNSESMIQQTKNAKQNYEIGEQNKLIGAEQLAQEKERTRLLKHDVDIKVGRPFASDEPSSFGFNPRTLSAVMGMLGIGNGAQGGVGLVPTAVNALKNAQQRRAEKRAEKQAEKERAKVEKKRSDYVGNAWRNNAQSVGAINYSHGYGRSNGY